MSRIPSVAVLALAVAACVVPAAAQAEWHHGGGGEHRGYGGYHGYGGEHRSYGRGLGVGGGIVGGALLGLGVGALLAPPAYYAPPPVYYAPPPPVYYAPQAYHPDAWPFYDRPAYAPAYPDSPRREIVYVQVPPVRHVATLRAHPVAHPVPPPCACVLAPAPR